MQLNHFLLIKNKPMEIFRLDTKKYSCKKCKKEFKNVVAQSWVYEICAKCNSEINS